MLQTDRWQPADIINLLVTLAFIVLALASWARLPRLYALYTSAVVLVVLLKVGEMEPLLSASRYLLAAFPGFIVLGQFARRPLLTRLVVYPSTTLLVLLTAWFAIWGWLA